ncbi:MAG: hypothetical protein IIZ78_03430 [Clostridiales bacterium]|nr:hypothetical protein [Clostridiales bacterium]
MKDLYTYIAEARTLKDLKGKQVSKISVNNTDNTVYIWFGCNFFDEWLLAFIGKPVSIMFNNIKDDIAYITFYRPNIEHLEESIKHKSLHLISGYPRQYRLSSEFRSPSPDTVKKIMDAIGQTYQQYHFEYIDDPEEWLKNSLKKL